MRLHNHIDPGGGHVTRYAEMSQPAREKLGIILISVFLAGWISVSFGIQIYQGIHAGYGLGFTNRGHLPDEIRDRYDIGPDVTKEELSERTRR